MAVTPGRNDVTETVDREQVEDFLYLEAELLDDWRLQDWFALFTEDCRYQIPSADLPPDASPETNLFYVDDGHVRLRERVVRLMKRSAHAEFPHSKTRHLISNVRLRDPEEDDEVAVSCAFVVHRCRYDVVDSFIGSSRYRLRRVDGALRIREKRCRLDVNSLRDQGRISILL